MSDHCVPGTVSVVEGTGKQTHRGEQAGGNMTAALLALGACREPVPAPGSLPLASLSFGIFEFSNDDVAIISLCCNFSSSAHSTSDAVQLSAFHPVLM